MPRKTTANAAKDELLAEFQALVADTEKLLQEPSAPRSARKKHTP